MKAIDLFAGAGGFTAGAELAGARVIWAGNHWRAAVDVHRANHPNTLHSCQDLHQADWAQVPPMDMVLASPACQGHSRARGKERPHHDRTRSTAWAVVSCAEFHRPRALVVENVPEFQRWALFPAWRLALEVMGYALSETIVDAADCGVPQHRRRLFVVGVQSRTPLHLKLPTEPHVPASEIIDWDSGAWSLVCRRGRALSTIERWRAGLAKCGRRFVMPYYGSGSGLTGRPLDRPLGTVTTRDRWALVDGGRMRMLTVDEYRAAMGFPVDYELPASPRSRAIHLLGNAVPPPMAAHVIRQVLMEVA